MTPTPRELSIVADDLPVAIWLGRVPGGEVVYTNKAFREVLGIEPPEGINRGAWVEPYGVHLPNGDPYPEHDMPYERAVRARETVVLEDLVIHRRDGRRVNLRVFAKPIFDEAGVLTHVLEAFTDITREVVAERERAETDRRLARAQRLESIGALVAGIAHDFNNLLTVTKLEIAALRSTEQDPSRRESLTQVDSVTDSAVRLIKNLLGFVRREKQVMAPVVLEDVVRPIVEMASRSFHRAIKVRTELEPRSLAVLGDASQLEQVLMNLVINARDAISGEGEILIRTSSVDLSEGDGGAGLSAGRYASLEVHDNGSGIAPELRERVFEPYFTTKTLGPNRGTGLGLATVHGIVSTHRGSVEALDNTSGRGTVMRVLLPRAAEDTIRERTRAGYSKAQEVSGNDRLLLVVDDERIVRSATSTSLRGLGFRVCEASDGQSAIALLEEKQDEIAGIVFDVVMPGLHGTELFRALRAIRDDVPFIVVSGSGLEGEAEAILDLGAATWLAKPYDARQLAAGLARAGVL